MSSVVKFALCFVSICLISVNTYSQEPTNQSYCIDSQEPEYPGGNAELIKFLQRNIKNNLCVDFQQFSDTLLIKFTICKDGVIKDVSVIKGLNEAIDAEVVRLMQRSPPWKPAKKDGRAIEVIFTAPIAFSRAI